MAKEPDRVTLWLRNNPAAAQALTISLIIAGTIMIFVNELTRPGGRSGPLWLTILSYLTLCSGIALKRASKVPTASPSALREEDHQN